MSLAQIVRERAEKLIADAEAANRVVWPEIPRNLVEFLEQQFPPRCLEPGETVESHLRYAGMVSLVAEMRDAFERDHEPSRHEEDPGAISVEIT